MNHKGFIPKRHKLSQLAQVDITVKSPMLKRL